MQDRTTWFYPYSLGFHGLVLVELNLILSNKAAITTEWPQDFTLSERPLAPGPIVINPGLAGMPPDKNHNMPPRPCTSLLSL